MRDRQPRPVNGDEALERLLAGNRRFVEGKLHHETRGGVRRDEVAGGQSPFAIVVGCADSRVPPEVVFDEGLGDVFTVRVAGNTGNDPLIVGSVEYAATNLDSVLFMVLGHDECGAVKAAIDVVLNGKTLPGQIGAVVEPILPAVEEVRSVPDGTRLDQAVKANIRHSVNALRIADPLIADLVSSGKLKLVGAEYRLESGKVDLLAT
jgi:carbonic anhydrase